MLITKLCRSSKSELKSSAPLAPLLFYLNLRGYISREWAADGTPLTAMASWGLGGAISLCCLLHLHLLFSTLALFSTRRSARIKRLANCFHLLPHLSDYSQRAHRWMHFLRRFQD